MLEIRQIEDKGAYAHLLERMNLSAEEASVIESVDSSQITGFGIFSSSVDSVHVHFIESHGNLYLYDGIIRTILFKAMVQGIDKAEFYLTDLTAVRELGLLEKERTCISSIQKIMSGCKKCK